MQTVRGESMKTVKDILAEYLVKNDYDGLCADGADCGCLLSDLMPCQGEGIEHCQPAWRVDCDGKDCDNDICDFHMVLKHPGDKRHK